jgi:hypothetical protein
VDSPLLEIAEALTALADQRQMLPDPPPPAISPAEMLVESRLHVRTLAEVLPEDCDYPSEDTPALPDATAEPRSVASTARDDRSAGLLREMVRHASASVVSLLYGWHSTKPTG